MRTWVIDLGKLASTVRDKKASPSLDWSNGKDKLTGKPGHKSDCEIKQILFIPNTTFIGAHCNFTMRLLNPSLKPTSNFLLNRTSLIINITGALYNFTSNYWVFHLNSYFQFLISVSNIKITRITLTRKIITDSKLSD